MRFGGGEGVAGSCVEAWAGFAGGAVGAEFRGGRAAAGAFDGFPGPWASVFVAGLWRADAGAVGRRCGPSAVGVDDGDASSAGLGAGSGRSVAVLDPVGDAWLPWRHRVFVGGLASAGARRLHRLVAGCASRQPAAGGLQSPVPDSSGGAGCTASLPGCCGWRAIGWPKTGKRRTRCGR